MLRNGSKSLKISSVCLSMPLLMSLAATLMQPSAAQAGGFLSTCKDEQLVFESGKVLLKAKCADNDIGFHRPSSLVISDRIANYGGNLTWARNGNFQASCSEIQIRVLFREDKTITLGSRCGDGKGGHNMSYLNLDEKISNQNGVLAIDHF